GNWYYAVRDYLAVGSASVKVFENCEYEMKFTFNFFDRYNWDRGKLVEVLGEPVFDDELGRLHRVGFAQEYEMRGSDTVTIIWKQGERFKTSGDITDPSGRTGR
ncbi:MAG: hypothetical protein ACRD8U_05285, partial [Pyrinomonadaceae bacterium]